MKTALSALLRSGLFGDASLTQAHTQAAEGTAIVAAHLEPDGHLRLGDRLGALSADALAGPASVKTCNNSILSPALVAVVQVRAC